MDTKNTEQNQSNINQQTKNIRRVSYKETDFDLATVSSSALQQLLNARSTTTQAVELLPEQIDYNLSSYFLPPPLEPNNDTGAVSLTGANGHDNSILL
jgi:hypothetical protein